MSVTSRTLNVTIPLISNALTFRAVGMAALCVGMGLWTIGARFTVLGAPRVLHAWFAVFGLDITIGVPIGWGLLVLSVLVGGIVSLIEFGCYPRRSFFAESLIVGSVLFVIWLLVNGSDLSSTFVGITTTSPASWPITRYIADRVWATVGCTVVLSYAPELLILGGVRWIITGRA